MEISVDPKNLYELQNTILQLVMSLENAFYLTGGTALHRFYCHNRYSFDLDFFISNSPNFYEDVQEILTILAAQNYHIKQEIAFRDFYRLHINNSLQVDFVNDRVYRYGKSNIINGFRIDNQENILANKLTAIVSRDEEKDFFDIVSCAFYMKFNWHTMLEIANKKAPVEKDTLIYRITSFPLFWLEKLPVIKPLTLTQETIKILCNDILHETDNSLYQQES